MMHSLYNCILCKHQVLLDSNWQGKCHFCKMPIKEHLRKTTKYLGEAVLTSTHNLCFGAKIRKIDIPLHTPVLLKMGFKGVCIVQTCFPDV